MASVAPQTPPEAAKQLPAILPVEQLSCSHGHGTQASRTHPHRGQSHTWSLDDAASLACVEVESSETVHMQSMSPVHVSVLPPATAPSGMRAYAHLPCVQGLAYADLMKLRRVAHQQTPRCRPAPNSPQGWHPHPPGTSSKPGTGGPKGSTRPGSPVPAIAGMNPRGSMAARPGSPEFPPSARGLLMNAVQSLPGRAYDMEHGLAPHGYPIPICIQQSIGVRKKADQPAGSLSALLE